MPYIPPNTRSVHRRRSLSYVIASVVMSLVISVLLALTLYAVGVRNEKGDGQLEYSMTQLFRQNPDSIGVVSNFDTPWPHQMPGVSIDADGRFKCPKRHFLCNSTMACVDLSRRCDGYVDCSGAEDELECVCAFRMPLDKFCDKYPDCFDESDENFCSYCPEDGDSFNCGNGQCVARTSVCDSKVDCQNAMDETFCYGLVTDLDYINSGTSNNFQPVLKTGFLINNQNGVWYPMCASTDDPTAIDTLVSYACVSITANPMATSRHEPRRFSHVTPDSGHSREFVYPMYGKLVKWEGCVTNEGIHVSCNDFLCGFNPKLLLPRPPRGRIVGGDTSEPGAWPWHAAIYRNGTYACGATLISDQWLISAAHCFFNYHINYYEIQLGMMRRRSFTPHQKIHKVNRIITHKRFNIVTLEFDIAMIKVSEPVTFDFWIRPICLPRPGKVENSGAFCTAIGWGDMGETEVDSDDLQEVHVPLTTSCRRSDRWLCAGYPEGGRDACQGDSGGPLMCPRSDGMSWYIAGVISAGTGCARPRTPGMYTRVAYYLDWIRQVSISDESRDDHPLTSCPGWKCAAVGGGNCLHVSKVCDGHVDCYDAQDEVDCFDGRKIVRYRT